MSRALPASALTAALRLPDVDRHGESWLNVILPWDVVVPDNDKYGVVMVKGRPRIILTKRYRDAKEAASQIAMLACKGHGYAVGCVHVELNVYPPDKRKRDIANTLKLICDAFTGVAYEDDSQITSITVHRRSVDRKYPRVIASVSPAPCPDSLTPITDSAA